jgi:hypothetical protein
MKARSYVERGPAPCSHDKGNAQLLQRRKVFLKNVRIDDVIEVPGEQQRSLSKEKDGHGMLAGAQTQSDTKRFDRAMRLCGVRADHDCNT